MYIVLTQTPHIKSHKLMGILRAHTGAIGCIGLKKSGTALPPDGRYRVYRVKEERHGSTSWRAL